LKNCFSEAEIWVSFPARRFERTTSLAASSRGLATGHEHLTDRQREVLRTAFEERYYDWSWDDG